MKGIQAVPSSPCCVRESAELTSALFLPASAVVAEEALLMLPACRAPRLRDLSEVMTCGLGG